MAMNLSSSKYESTWRNDIRRQKWVALVSVDICGYHVNATSVLVIV